MYLELHQVLQGSTIQRRLVYSIQETIDHLRRRELSKEQHKQLEQVQATLEQERR